MIEQREVVIDLGSVRAEADEPRPRAWRWRPLAAVACAVLVIAASTAAAGPAADAQPQAVTVIASDAPDLIYPTPHFLVAEVEGVTSAYRLADGTRLWPVPPGIQQIYAVSEVGVRLVFIGRRAGSDRTTIMAVDPATGQPAWQRGEELAATGTGGRTVVVITGTGRAAPVAEGLDAATGAVRWRLAAPAGSSFSGAVPSMAMSPQALGHDGLMLLRADHTLASVSIEDGSVTEIGPTVISSVTVWDARTVVGDITTIGPDDGVQPLGQAAYDRATGRELWRTAVPNEGTTDCGLVVCRYTLTGFSGVDWRTGRENWHTDSLSTPSGYWYRDGEELIVALEQTMGRYTLLDAATGAARYRVPRLWVPLMLVDGSMVMLMSWNSRDFRPWVGRLPGSGPLELRVQHPVDGPGAEALCQPADDRLLCRRGDTMVVLDPR